MQPGMAAITCGSISSTTTRPSCIGRELSKGMSSRDSSCWVDGRLRRGDSLGNARRVTGQRRRIHPRHTENGVRLPVAAENSEKRRRRYNDRRRRAPTRLPTASHLAAHADSQTLLRAPFLQMAGTQSDGDKNGQALTESTTTFRNHSHSSGLIRSYNHFCRYSEPKDSCILRQEPNLMKTPRNGNQTNLMTKDMILRRRQAERPEQVRDRQLCEGR
jgi:hypothetical protein